MQLYAVRLQPAAVSATVYRPQLLCQQVASWKRLCGPESTFVARQEAPKSLRAQVWPYGCKAANKVNGILHAVADGVRCTYDPKAVRAASVA